MQLILAGVNPQLPDPNNQDKKPFENICPHCAQTKANQRPRSSRRIRGDGLAADFQIKKG